MPGTQEVTNQTSTDSQKFSHTTQRMDGAEEEAFPVSVK